MFGAVGLLLLLRYSDKIEARQAQLEHQYRARQVAGQATGNPNASLPWSEEGAGRLPLVSLIWLLSWIIAIAGITLIWQHGIRAYQQVRERTRLPRNKEEEKKETESSSDSNPDKNGLSTLK